MDILIIGNGFDIAHGLRTSYKDFLEFCYKEITKPIANINKLLPGYENFYKTNIYYYGRRSNGKG